MSKLKNKLIAHFEGNYASSPHPLDDAEIQLLIANNCECCNCGTSVFDLYDFPVINTASQDDPILCEDCYREHNYYTCVLCNEDYHISDANPDYFVLNPTTAQEQKMKAGLYLVLDRPFSFGNIVSGFDAFFQDSIKLVREIDLDKMKQLKCGDNVDQVDNGELCSNCLKTLLRQNPLNSYDSNIPIILLLKYEGYFLSNMTLDQLKAARQRLVHERISVREMLVAGR